MLVSAHSLIRCDLLKNQKKTTKPPKNRFTYKTLCRCRKKKTTGKLQMKRIGFSDKRSHLIKE